MHLKRMQCNHISISGADHYSVFARFADGNEIPREFENIKLTNYTIGDLESGSGYEIQVVAFSSDGLKSDRSLKILQYTCKWSFVRLDAEF